MPCEADGMFAGSVIVDDEHVAANSFSGFGHQGAAGTVADTPLADCISISGDVYISGDPANADIFSVLERIGGALSLNDLTSGTLDAFESLQSVGGALTIRDASVVEIRGFPILIETGEIIVTDGNIESIVGLTALKEVSSSILLRNSRLADLSGLSTLETIGGALMMLDTQTTDLRALDNVRTIGGSLYINRSPIAQLGLARLEAVELEVLITETPLASMNGLNALRAVGKDLRITNNGNLPGDAARAWADGVDVLGETVVCQNLEGDLDPC